MKTKENTQFKKSRICEVFNLVKQEDNKIMIAVGQFIVDEKKFDTYEQADRYIGTKPYRLIINLISLAIYENEQTKKTTKSSKRSKEVSNKDKKELPNNEN